MSQRVFAIAAALLSEHGENPEYDRAIVELTCELVGLGITDNRDRVAEVLRALNPIQEVGR